MKGDRWIVFKDKRAQVALLTLSYPLSMCTYLSNISLVSLSHFLAPGGTWDHLPLVRQEHRQQWQLSNGFSHHCRPWGPVVKGRAGRVEEQQKRERDRDINCTPQETSQLIMQITQWLFNICSRSTWSVVIGNLQQHIWYSNEVTTHFSSVTYSCTCTYSAIAKNTKNCCCGPSW